MRTYTRKKPECQLIEGAENMCRLCLGKLEGPVVPIFGEDSRNVSASLAMRIMLCVGLEITHEECLPDAVCLECNEELKRCYSFRKKCEVTYQKLKSHALAVKRKTAQECLEIESKDNVINTEETMTSIIDNSESINILKTEYFNSNFNGLLKLNDGFNTKTETTESLIMTENTNSSDEINMEIDTVQPIDKSQEMSECLSNILLQLGILVQHENALHLTSEVVVELESGDGQQITLELAEEDEEVESTQLEVSAPVPAQPLVVPPEVLNKSNYKVEYVTTENMNSNEGMVNPETWCQVCGRSYATRAVLLRHQRIHAGVKPFRCDHCARTFTQKAMLTRHMAVHLEKRPFACASCPKSFTQRGALEAHRRVQHRESAADGNTLQLHRCPAHACDKVFLFPSGLSRHMMMHRGRIHTCSNCMRSFTDRSALIRHLRKANHTELSTLLPTGSNRS